MHQARAIPLPSETLHIEEIKFWLKSMQEHTKFIRAGLPIEATDFIDAAKEFSRAFTSVLQKLERIKNIKQSKALLNEIFGVMEEFCRYQRKLLAEKLNGKLGGSNFPFFLDHLLREARCFLEFLERLNSEKTSGGSISYTKEIVVWLRFMSDHTKLIGRYIDPSECRIGKMTADFVDLFEHLVLEARDLASMLYCHKGEVRAFHRFLLDIRTDVQHLRDFHKMAEELIGDCRLLGIISIELAIHMKREAEHCLLMIALLEKEIMQNCPDDFQDDIDADLWLDTERLELESSQLKLPEIKEDVAAVELPVTEPTPIAADVSAARTDEPIVAVLPRQQSQKIDTSVELRSELPAMIPLPAEQTADNVSPAPEFISSTVTQQAPAFVTAGIAKPIPSKFAGIAPGERYSKYKNQQRLPRPLGKVNQ